MPEEPLFCPECLILNQSTQLITTIQDNICYCPDCGYLADPPKSS